jgi:predicted dehydrogenase
MAAPIALASDFCEKPETAPIRLGILGLGQRGAALAEACLNTPGLQLDGLFDPHKPTLDRVAARLARLAGDTPKCLAAELELLESRDLDAVIIATPADLHPRQIVTALSAGKQILTEKPAGLSRADLETILPLVERLEKQVFMVAHERRCHPRRGAFVEWLQSKPMGDLVDIQAGWTHPQGPPCGRDNWLLNPARSGDWVAEHGDHLWEMLLEIAGGDIPEITDAHRRTNGQECSRFFSVQMRWPASGATAHVRHSMLPGGNFQSPGLSCVAQYEKGQYDMIRGRVSAAEAIRRSAPDCTTVHDETQAMLAMFVRRVRFKDQTEALQIANQQECRLAMQVHEFRTRIQSRWA